MQRLDDKDAHINSLEDDVKSLTALLANQDETNREQNSRIREQNFQIREQNTRIQHLEEIVCSTSNENQDTSEDTSGQEQAHSSATSSKSASALMPPNENAANRIRRQYAGMHVAFLAQLTNRITNASILQTIVFDKVLTNVGGASNVHLGSFVAPLSGVYLFSITLQVYPGNFTFFRFVKNNYDQVSRLFASTTPDENVSVAQTVVLQLAKGDDMTVRYENPGESIIGNSLSTFTGFLIWGTENIHAVVG
ncbi:C1QT3-like protein [Mya arenaria]|uniref:C1QT3-like protein n=1 Tax=Mya arenaria TaxID=6604 RepID=A0ABY7FUN7_MYAAR|nr:C1QT3-like protein [Mya arenaria]